MMVRDFAIHGIVSACMRKFAMHASSPAATAQASQSYAQVPSGEPKINAYLFSPSRHDARRNAAVDAGDVES